MDNEYVIGNISRHRKLFDAGIYFTLDNWWYEFNIRNNRTPTFTEMQQICARRGIAGYVNGRPATYPDSSMRSIYNRLCHNPDPTIRKCLGISGKCAPLSKYRHERIFYMSKEADSNVKKAIEKELVRLKSMKMVKG